MIRGTSASLTVATCLVVACRAEPPTSIVVDSSPPPLDAPADAAIEAPIDAGIDATIDATVDASIDAPAHVQAGQYGRCSRTADCARGLECCVRPVGIQPRLDTARPKECLTPAQCKLRPP